MLEIQSANLTFAAIFSPNNLQIPLYSALTLKALITTAADDIHKYFFIVFQRK